MCYWIVIMAPRIMPKAAPLLLTAALAALVPGCVETKEEFTLNPDGSGKVVCEAILPAQGPILADQPNDDLDFRLKKTVHTILTESSGVEAWKDVSYRWRDDGRIAFKGTAYFKDMSQLKLTLLALYGLQTPSIGLSKTADGFLVLELKRETAKKETTQTAAPELTEDQLRTKVRLERVNFQAWRPTLVALTTGLKMTRVFHLPGADAGSTNLTREADGALRMTCDGKRLIDASDALIADDARFREFVRSGDSLSAPTYNSDLALNELIFGSKAPVRAVRQGPLKPLFDYAAEVADAKKGYPAILQQVKVPEKLPQSNPVQPKPDPPPAAPPARGGDFKLLRVAGVKIGYLTEQFHDLWPSYTGWGDCELSVVGELPGAVVAMDSGRVEKAIADNGEMLLPEGDSRCTIHFPHLSEDKAAVIFSVPLKRPGPGVRGFKEVTGSLIYYAGEGSKQVDVGIREFKAGAVGTDLGARIESIEPDQFYKECASLRLQFDRPYHAIQSVAFFDAQGKALDASPNFWTGNSIGFKLKGSFPPTGRIVARVYEKFNRYSIPFRVTDVSLTGHPLR